MKRPTFRVLDIVWASVVVSLAVALFVSEAEKRKLRDLAKWQGICSKMLDLHAGYFGSLYAAARSTAPEDAARFMHSLEDRLTAMFRETAGFADTPSRLELLGLGIPAMHADQAPGYDSMRAKYSADIPELREPPRDFPELREPLDFSEWREPQ